MSSEHICAMGCSNEKQKKRYFNYDWHACFLVFFFLFAIFQPNEFIIIWNNVITNSVNEIHFISFFFVCFILIHIECDVLRFWFGDHSWNWIFLIRKSFGCTRAIWLIFNETSIKLMNCNHKLNSTQDNLFQFISPFNIYFGTQSMESLNMEIWLMPSTLIVKSFLHVELILAVIWNVLLVPWSRFPTHTVTRVPFVSQANAQWSKWICGTWNE